MLSELGLLGETLATLLAGKWSLTFVQTLMLLQSGFTPEGPLTFGAPEGPLPRVNDLVLSQAALHAVALLALTTLEMLLLTQDHPLHLRSELLLLLYLGYVEGWPLEWLLLCFTKSFFL